MPDKKHITILTPVFNDWESLRLLLIDINELIPRLEFAVSMTIVDDGSTNQIDVEHLVDFNSNFNQVCLLTLVTNLGHQRAIAAGLVQVAQSNETDAVLVMDCDGEDRSSDIFSLVAASEKDTQAIIVAQRARRSEGALFRVFYAIYKSVFRILTGRNVDFGNFCLIPKDLLDRIIYMPELWNHLSGSIIRSKCRIIKVPTHRGQRNAGRSSMNIQSLMTHGFSAISVFTDVLFVRLLIFTGITSSFALFGGFIIVLLRLGTDYAIPGWASTLVSLAVVVLIQSLTLLMIGIFMMLANRSAPSFIPAIHAKNFILTTQPLVARVDS